MRVIVLMTVTQRSLRIYLQYRQTPKLNLDIRRQIHPIFPFLPGNKRHAILFYFVS